MPTNNGPMPPANPYDGGISTQIRTKKSKPHRQRRAPLPFKKNTGFYIFFLDCLKNSPLFSFAAFLVISIFILSIIELWISFTHLAEYQKLLEKNLEPSARDMENINSLRNWFSLLGFVLPLLVIAFFSCLTKSIMKILDKYPQRVFIFIMILGGVSAFFIPQFLYSFKYIGETKDITTTLLTVTGGVLAIFTLLKTHQKNILDKETLDFESQKYAESIEDRKKDIAKQEKLRQEQKSQFNMTLAQQKDKDSQEHIRQVHAERRVRYAKAVEHLAGEKPAVRTGGIYALVGLVDEWLADSSVEEDAKDIEAQIIINTLCAYIRSPFDLAEKQNSLEHPLPPEDYDGNFSEDYAKFHEEANLRMSFFYEIDKRINIDINGDEVDFSGPWSKYKFNFDNAPIFYRLHGLKLGTSSFKGARFHGAGDFRYSRFGGDVEFTDATFTSELIFNNMVFCGVASFRGTIFKEKLTFHETAFKNDVYFDDAEFMGPANFGGSLFEGLVNFKNANFSEKPYFVRKEGDSTIYAAFSYKIDSSEHKFADLNGRIKTKPTVFMKKRYEIPEGAVIFDPTSLDEETQTYKSISSPAGAAPGTRDRSILFKM